MPIDWFCVMTANKYCHKIAPRFSDLSTKYMSCVRRHKLPQEKAARRHFDLVSVIVRRHWINPVTASPKNTMYSAAVGSSPRE